LIWLEADTIIRQRSHGARSLDDFCRQFYGGTSGAPVVVTYTFEDVVTALNEAAAYDWRNFFLTRLESNGPHAPLGGIEGGGWRLVYTDVVNEHLRSAEEATNVFDVRFSLGVILRHKENDKDDGKIIDVIPGSPAAQAGIGPGMKLIAVNGRQWSPVLVREAIRSAKGGAEPIELLVENAEYYKTCRVDYHDGERYPHLEREPGRSDLLEQILRARAPVRAK